MGQLLIKILFLLLIASLWSTSLELSFLASLLVIAVCFSNKFSKELVNYLAILGLLFLIGFIGIFTFKEGWYDFIKDSVYFLRPMTVMIASYLVVVKLKNKPDFFNLIVLAGFAFAFVHMAHIALKFFDVSANVSSIRNYFGRYNHVELVALFIVICVKELPMKRSRFKIVYQFFVACLALSFIMYFSRTMIIVLALMFLAYRGYLKLNTKGLIYVSILMLLGASFGFFISQYEPSNNTGVINTFLLKMKNSYTEAFKSINIDQSKMDRRELWAHWRAYEANLVYDEVDKERKWILGKGFGSTVDVGFEIRLQEKWIQKLPTTHNGMAYVYMKTGILGMMIYGLSILLFYLYYYSKDKDEKIRSYNHLLASYSFYMLISSLVVTGIFKPYDMVTLLIGGTFALKQYRNFENRNSRDKGDT